jgi:hypothetical protein
VRSLVPQLSGAGIELRLCSSAFVSTPKKAMSQQPMISTNNSLSPKDAGFTVTGARNLSDWVVVSQCQES